MAELTNITDPKYRCSIGACPAVYRDRTPERMRCGPLASSCPAVLDDDSGNFVFIGEHLDPLPEELAGKVGDTEAAVKLSADLLLSSLEVAELVEAAKPIAERASKPKLHVVAGGCQLVAVPLHELRTLVAALSRMKGGK